MIAVIDYGSGNLRSVYNAFRYIGQDVKVCQKSADLKGAGRVVLPGVGSSRDAMEGLKKNGLTEAVLEHIGKDRPFLGICLGLQLLFKSSEESGGCDCLGVVDGKVRLFPGGEGLKVPQIGWNTVKILKKDCPVLKGIDDNTYFYFVHSYFCDNAEKEYTAGLTDYGIKYTSVFWKGNAFAVQFHPERSQDDGLKILKNFSEV